MDKTVASSPTVAGKHFTDQTVVILNARTAIGRALSDLFLSEGANVVTDGGLASAAFETAVRSHGGIDILVNLIDSPQDSSLSESTETGWQSVLAELKAAYKVCRRGRTKVEPDSYHMGHAVNPNGLATFQEATVGQNHQCLYGAKQRTGALYRRVYSFLDVTSWLTEDPKQPSNSACMD